MRFRWFALSCVVAGILSCSGGGGSTSSPANPKGGVFAYVVNEGGDNVTAFTIGSGGVFSYLNGSLTTSAFTTGSLPWAAAASPNGNYLYVANMGTSATAGGTGTISAFTISPNGVLGPITTGSLTTGAFPVGIAVSPNGDYLYISNQGGSNEILTFAIGSGGQLAPLGKTTGLQEPLGIAVSPNGQFLYVTNQTSTGPNGIAVFTIGSDGTLSAITSGSFTTGEGPTAIAISPDGLYLYVTNCNMYGGTGNQISAFAIGAGGVLSAITTGTFVTPGQDGIGIAISPNGKYLYVTNAGTGAGGISAFSIGSGGALAPIGSYPTGGDPWYIAISPDGASLYVTNVNSSSISAFAVGSDGTLSSIANTIFSTGFSGPAGICIVTR